MYYETTKLHKVILFEKEAEISVKIGVCIDRTALTTTKNIVIIYEFEDMYYIGFWIMFIEVVLRLSLFSFIYSSVVTAFTI